MRLCIDCKKFKPNTKDFFSVNRKRADGSQILRTRCKECYYEYRKKYKCRNVELRKKKLHDNYIQHQEKIKKRSKDRYYRVKQEDELKTLKEFFEEQQKKIKQKYE